MSTTLTHTFMTVALDHKTYPESASWVLHTMLQSLPFTTEIPLLLCPYHLLHPSSLYQLFMLHAQVATITLMVGTVPSTMGLIFDHHHWGTTANDEPSLNFK